MYKEYNLKNFELQKIVRDIKAQKLALEKIEQKLNFLENNNNANKLLNEKNNLKSNLKNLIDKGNKLNEELIDNEELFETIKMKYAIFLLLKFGDNELEYCIN